MSAQESRHSPEYDHSPCCPDCGGQGGNAYGPCWDCRGTGHPHPPLSPGQTGADQ